MRQALLTLFASICFVTLSSQTGITTIMPSQPFPTKPRRRDVRCQYVTLTFGPSISSRSRRRLRRRCPSITFSFQRICICGV